MGHWTLTVHGTGQHHNKNEKDADQMAVKFVADLKAAGHQIEHASLTIGGRESVVGPAK